MGLTLPAAQAFATTSSAGQSAGTGQSMSQGSTQTSGTSTGTKTTDKETPFNPWSLAPLAFAPLTGGTKSRRHGRVGTRRRAVRLAHQRLHGPRILATLEHDPEKWVPVFGKDHAQTKS